MEMRTYSVITSAIQQSMAEIPFFIAASNLTDVYFVFSHNFSAKAADGTENVAFLKGQAAPGAAGATGLHPLRGSPVRGSVFIEYPGHQVQWVVKGASEASIID